MSTNQLELAEMADAAQETGRDGGRRNLLCDYYPLLERVMQRLASEAHGDPHSEAFQPPFALPTLDRSLRDFFGAATASWAPLGDYGETPLTLLNLMENPGTRTTKTMASLLMVARAVNFIRRTGEGIVIVAPTSGNKGVALRDAVERAIATGLVRPDQLRVLTIVPLSSRRKLRNSRLASEAELRNANPVFAYGGAHASGVKELAREFVRAYGGSLREKHGLNAWYALDLRNYQGADAARAFIENDVEPLQPPGKGLRIHAHAVSSAYGLLGYHLGRAILRDAGQAASQGEPGFLLVQHLATPDMVLSLYHDSCSRQNIPNYRRNSSTGLFEQFVDPHFPQQTLSPEESIDSTFYTREPVTVQRMNALIRSQGGAGMTVSLWECLSRYGQIRMMLERAGVAVPADPREILEWSVIMTLAGVMNALDRKVLSRGSSVIVHGTGLYSTGDTPDIDARAVRLVQTPQDMASALGGL
jgi:hypothetical protein